MTASERKEFERELRDYVDAKITKLRKSLARMEAVKKRDATVVLVWRKGYKETKIRTVTGHYLHVVKRLP